MRNFKYWWEKSVVPTPGRWSGNAYKMVAYIKEKEAILRMDLERAQMDKNRPLAILLKEQIALVENMLIWAERNLRPVEETKKPSVYAIRKEYFDSLGRR